MKKLTGLIIIILIVLIGWTAFTKKAPFTPSADTDQQTKDFTEAQDYGFSFSYNNEKLIAVGQTEETRGDLVYRIALFNKKDYAELLASSEPREGPTAISLEVFRNPMNLEPAEWIKTHPAANFAFAVPNSIGSQTISTTDYTTYEWDGLYRARAYATIQNSYLYLFTVTHLSENDPLLNEMNSVLENIHWNVPKIPAQVAHGDIKVELPQINQEITSPLKIKGVARGFWFFEATAPLVLVDWDGKIIAESYISAEGEWMTENFVPFTGEITFTKPTYGERGALILKKQNAADLPELDDAIELPILFK